MPIKFHNPKELDRNLKISIHKSGKMGFTVEAANKMKLAVGKSAAIGTEDDNSEDVLYMLIYEEIRDDAFRVSKAGGYFYINTKPLFDTLKIDYIKRDLVYDVTEETIDGQQVFVLKRRDFKKKYIED